MRLKYFSYFGRVKNLLIFVSLLHFGILSSQNKIIDSLSFLLKAAKPDTNKVILLNKLAWESAVVASQRSLSYSKEAYSLAESLNYERGIFRSKAAEAHVLYVMGNLKESKKIYLDIISHYKETNNVIALGRIYNSISSVCDQLGESDKALYYLIEAAKIYQHHKDPNANMNLITNINLGTTTMRRKDYKKAIFYFNNAATFITDNQRDGYDGAIYVGLASAHLALNKYEEAWKYFSIAEKIYTKIGYDNGLASIYSDMSASFIQLNENKKARLYAKKAIQKYALAYLPNEMADCLSNISTSYFNEWMMTKGSKNPVHLDSAYYYLDSALRICRRFDLKTLEMAAYKSLSNILAQQMKFAESLNSLNNYLILHDSLMSVEKEARINEINTRYEVEKTETENLHLSGDIKNQKLVILILSMLFVTIVAFGMLLFRQNKLKGKQKQLQLEQKLLRSQMNPHFIFNALIAIESFIYKNEAKSAGKYLSTFAKLMRLILENSREDYITLEKDIQTLKYYLDLQKLRFNNKFEYNFDVAENVDINNTLIAPMLIQPFIENAIEHGLSNNEEHGKIIISFKKESDKLVIEVKDNGSGFSASANTTKTHYSMATTIVKERLAILSYKRKNFSLELKDIKENNTVTGAMVRFTIPYMTYV